MFVFLLTNEQKDGYVLGAGMLVGLICLYPLYFWLLRRTRGLPLWPVFCMVTGVTGALPMVQNPASMAAYTSGEIVAGGATVAGFVILGTAVWFFMTSRPTKPPRALLMISRSKATSVLLAFIAAGLLFQLNQSLQLVRFPGNTMQIVRGVTGSLSTLGLFVLSFYYGQNLLSRWQAFLLVALGSGVVMAAITGLLLGNVVVPVAMMLFGFMLGSGRIPWKGLVAAIILLAILHPGKFAMREAYWEQGKKLSLESLPSFYADWIGYSLAEVGTFSRAFRVTSQEGERSTMFERSGNLHMLLLVQKSSPQSVPFLAGATYAHIPRLLVPRMLDENKGVSHEGNMILSVTYNLQTADSLGSTSIGWGLIPEAYANFGYIGVVILAVVLAAFYAMAERLSINVPMTSFRFVVGLLFMAASTQADTMGVFVSSQFQGVMGLLLASLLLMRRQPNPFYEEGWMPEPAPNPEASRGASIFNGVTSLRATKVPRRVTAWMPPGMRSAILARGAAERRAHAADSQRKEEGRKPRQVAVPYQNYRRFRG